MKEDDAITELELIERYLAEKLTGSEKEKVETKISTEPEFASKLEDLRQIKQLLRTATVQQRARTELRDIFLESRTPKWYSSRRLWLSTVAAAALIGVVMYFGTAPVTLPSITDDLLTIRNETPMVNESRGDVTTYDQLLAGQKAIENRNYLMAIDYLEKVEREKDLRSYFREAAQWYLVVAFLNSDQPKSAERYYDSLRRLDNPEYPVDWVERCKLYVQIQRRKLF